MYIIDHLLEWKTQMETLSTHVSGHVHHRACNGCLLGETPMSTVMSPPCPRHDGGNQTVPLNRVCVVETEILVPSKKLKI